MEECRPDDLSRNFFVSKLKRKIDEREFRVRMEIDIYCVTRLLFPKNTQLAHLASLKRMWEMRGGKISDQGKIISDDVTDLEEEAFLHLLAIF